MLNNKTAVAPARTNVGFDVIAQKRRRLLSEIRLNVGAAYLWIAWVYSGLLFATIAPLIAPVSFLGEGPPVFKIVNLAMFAFVAGFALVYGRYLFQRRNPVIRLKQLVPAGSLLTNEVWSTLRPASALVGFAPEQINVHLAPNDLSASAFTFSIRRKHYLGLSPAMVKIMRQNPRYARSVLIHELAHLQQKDTNAVAITFRFVKYQFILSLVLTPLLIFLYWSTSDQSDRPVAAVLLLILQFIFVAAIFFANRNLRRLSEKAADLLVILCGEGEGLQEILQASLRDAPALSFAQRLSGNHPLIAKRIQWAKEAESAISRYAAEANDSKSFRLRALDFAKTAGLVLVRGFFYAMVAVLVIVLYVWIRVSLAPSTP